LSAVLKQKLSPGERAEQYTKGEVQRAGETLILPKVVANEPERYLEALKVLSFWRSCHIAPLHHVVGMLEMIARTTDRSAIIAKRLKRAPSIIAKLTRFQSMKLRNMQDIGGCRVIMKSIRHVNKLKRDLKKRGDFRVTDYIAVPKDDGYRGVHLVGKFPGKEPGSQYSIEIQLRTAIQHSWATAVEIIDLFTNQSLKSNHGKQDWKDFFKAAGEALAELDGVPVDAEVHKEACAEVVRLAKRLDVLRLFDAYRSSLRILDTQGVKDVEGYYLLRIDTSLKTLQCSFFSVEEYERTIEKYLQAEGANIGKPEFVVALVSTSSLSDLKEAYPNYFADADVFVGHLKTVGARHQVRNPSWWLRFFIGLSRR
jgi:ppGpp synthetase/RelA/SpoT-type nucleotidyltranferase